MSLRTAGKQSPVLLAALILIGAWVVINALRVYETMEPIWADGGGVEIVGGAIGQTWFSGLVGLLVMLAFIGLVITLYSALSETHPAPERFPPER